MEGDRRFDRAARHSRLVVLVAIVIAAELGAGAAFLVGWRPHIAAMALAAFTLVAAAMFHLHPQEEVEMHLDFRDLGALRRLIVFHRQTVATRRGAQIEGCDEQLTRSNFRRC